MVYLISEITLKRRSLITDPTLGVYIKPAIELAQKIGLRSIIGECLLSRIQYLVSNQAPNTGKYYIDLPEYAAYKHLLDQYITDYLIYQVMSEIVIPYRDKMRNAGVVNTTDQNYQQPGFDEITYLKRYWGDKAEYFGARLREYLKEHTSDFPEYAECNPCTGRTSTEGAYHSQIVL